MPFHVHSTVILSEVNQFARELVTKSKDRTIAYGTPGLPRHSFEKSLGKNSFKGLCGASANTGSFDSA